jgi:AbrB family looped-hinge helix DNA binding protein
MADTYSITSKHQVTVPQDIRKFLGLAARDRLKFEREDNRVYVTKAMDAKSIQRLNNELLRKRGVKPATDKDLEEARDKFYKSGGTW